MAPHVSVLLSESAAPVQRMVSLWHHQVAEGVQARLTAPLLLALHLSRCAFSVLQPGATDTTTICVRHAHTAHGEDATSTCLCTNQLHSVVTHHGPLPTSGHTVCCSCR